MLSTLALHMQTVAVGWQLYALTGSAFDLGLVGLAQFVPTIALTPIVGGVADRYDRRLVVMVCHVALAGATAALALGTVGGWLHRDGILAIVSILGAARAFENPARAALVPRLVPLTLIPRAIASVTSAGQTARIVGPALGGVLYGLGPTTVYAIVAALYLVAAALIVGVRDVQPARPREEITPASLFSGVAFILRRRLLLGVLSLDLFAVLLGGATALLPIFARDILMVGPEGLGILYSASSIGAIGMAALMSMMGQIRRAGLWVMIGVAIFSVATIVFAVSTNFWLSAAMLALEGVGNTISVVLRGTISQLVTPDHLRGRVSSVNMLFTLGGPQLGQFRAGAVAEVVGAEWSALSGGLATLAVTLALAVGAPAVRTYEILPGTGRGSVAPAVSRR